MVQTPKLALLVLPILCSGCPSQTNPEVPKAVLCFDADTCAHDCKIARDETSCRLAACFAAKDRQSSYGFWAKMTAGAAGVLGLAASAVKSDWKYVPGGASAATGGLSAGLMYKADTESGTYDSMSCAEVFKQEELE